MVFSFYCAIVHYTAV